MDEATIALARRLIDELVARHNLALIVVSHYESEVPDCVPSTQVMELYEGQKVDNPAPIDR